MRQTVEETLRNHGEGHRPPESVLSVLSDSGLLDPEELGKLLLLVSGNLYPREEAWEKICRAKFGVALPSTPGQALFRRLTEKPDMLNYEDLHQDAVPLTVASLSDYALVVSIYDVNRKKNAFTRTMQGEEIAAFLQDGTLIRLDLPNLFVEEYYQRDAPALLSQRNDWKTSIHLLRLADGKCCSLSSDMFEYDRGFWILGEAVYAMRSELKFVPGAKIRMHSLENMYVDEEYSNGVDSTLDHDYSLRMTNHGISLLHFVEVAFHEDPEEFLSGNHEDPEEFLTGDALKAPLRGLCFRVDMECSVKHVEKVPRRFDEADEPSETEEPEDDPDSPIIYSICTTGLTLRCMFQTEGEDKYVIPFKKANGITLLHLLEQLSGWK